MCVCEYVPCMHFRFDPHTVNNNVTLQNFMQNALATRYINRNLELIFHSRLTTLLKLHVVDNIELIKLLCNLCGEGKMIVGKEMKK